MASMVFAACTPEQIIETVEVIIEGTPVVQTVIVGPEEPTEPPVVYPDTLVICQGQEPDTLYGYGGSMLAASHIVEAVKDGPIDARSFDYQAIILEKLPSLADGDAVIQTLTVAAGDTFIDADQNVSTLEAGVMYFPAGCMSTDCAVEYTEGDVEMSQMVVTFTMLSGLMWSDGTPLTTADSIYSFELNADPDTAAGKFAVERTASYEAVDDVTIVWTGLPGYMDSTYFINFWTPYPEHQLSQFTAAELMEAEETNRAPLGWGAYVLDEWVQGEAIYMSKNTNYFRADEGLPYFDNLIFKMVGENSNANVAAILSGECDVVDQTSHLDDQAELLLELQNAGQLQATFVTGTTFEHADFGINPVTYDDGIGAEDRPPFFSDVRTRQAITMCMDRQAVVDTVMFGQSVVLHTYLPPQHPLFNTDVVQYPFDVAAGSALLEEVGWVMGDDGVRVAAGVEGIADGTRLSLDFWTTTATQRQQATQIMAQTLLECGVEAKLEYWESGEYFADGPDGPIFGRRFDIGQYAWLTGVTPPCDLWITEGIPGEPDLTVGDVPWLAEALGEGADLTAFAFPYGWGGWNDPGYSNPAYDVACKTALASLPGQPAYEEQHLLAQAIFAEDLPIAPLYLRLKLAATRPDMCGFFMDPTANSEMWNIEEFGFGPWCEDM
jgi:peptide/nickel transport system substrate-binding protein